MQILQHWDCGLENLAKSEFDRAANATTSYPLSEAAKTYFTLTSKGRNVRKALRRIPEIFLEDGQYLNKSNKFGCNTQKREVQLIACIFEPQYATNLDYQDEDSTKP
ncbi:hypothetical protein DICVIV_00025 [Dictyocaulus viviparus]|uniref:Uncharacterized protein n=1 Tax=Dictyocaulus viviparus TaxID=29172 RepID=A0A0D8YBL3_DICVI|nr:hypothetical protein DICVIV_00025 [Dictyocaulus viviparus]